MSGRIFAYNTAHHALQTFENEDAVIASVLGIDIAEGEWLFFAADGEALQAEFSTPARIDHDRLTYTQGVYVLQPGSGSNLIEFLASRVVDGPIHLWNFEQMEAYFRG